MIYFIQARVSKAIKIGTANNPFTRFAAFKTSSPEPLVMLGTIPGSYPEEAALHRRFAEFRSHGEWFNGSPDFHRQVAEIISGTREHKPKGELLDSSDMFVQEASCRGMVMCPCCNEYSVWFDEEDSGGFLAPGDIHAGEFWVTFHGHCGSRWRIGFHMESGMIHTNLFVLNNCEVDPVPRPVSHEEELVRLAVWAETDD